MSKLKFKNKDVTPKHVDVIVKSNLVIDAVGGFCLGEWFDGVLDHAGMDISDSAHWPETLYDDILYPDGMPVVHYRMEVLVNDVRYTTVSTGDGRLSDTLARVFTDENLYEVMSLGISSSNLPTCYVQNLTDSRSNFQVKAYAVISSNPADDFIVFETPLINLLPSGERLLPIISDEPIGFYITEVPEVFISKGDYELTINGKVLSTHTEAINNNNTYSDLLVKLAATPKMMIGERGSFLDAWAESDIDLVKTHVINKTGDYARVVLTHITIGGRWRFIDFVLGVNYQFDYSANPEVVIGGGRG